MIFNTFVFRLIFPAIFVITAAVIISAQVSLPNKNEDEIIKVETELISVPVIVSDRQNRYIANLKSSNFSIYQDGKPRQIEFFVNEDAPITIALMLDTSRSTQWVLDDIKEAAVEFIRRLRPADRAVIVTFDNNVEVLSSVTSNKKELEEAIDNARIGESVGTVLNDAVSQVVDKNLKEVKGRKAVILLTDGKDAGSYVTKIELENRLTESDTMIYSIFYKTGFAARQGGFQRGGFGRGRIFGGMNEMRNRRIERQAEKNKEAAEFLQNIADSTAGRFYQNDVTQLNTIFSSIADELRKQYVLGFYPESRTEDGKSYQIKVQVDRPEAVVRAKNVYRRKSV